MYERAVETLCTDMFSIIYFILVAALAAAIMRAPDADLATRSSVVCAASALHGLHLAIYAIATCEGLCGISRGCDSERCDQRSVPSAPTRGTDTPTELTRASSPACGSLERAHVQVGSISIACRTLDCCCVHILTYSSLVCREPSQT